jgi:hypothetical protein
MKTHRSRYAEKLARRKKDGPIHFKFPVDSSGKMTLNPLHITGEKAFSRLRRSDES